MKKLSFLFVIFLSAIIVSCSGKKQKPEAEPSAHETFVSGLSGQDTAVVKKLCEDFLLAIKNNDKDQAFSILRSVDNGNVNPPTSEQMAKISNQFTIFPVLDFHLKDFKIGDATDNICSYAIVFDRDEQGKESTINFGFCPIKINGEWFITVRNASADLPQ